jgi:hypothetical protein
LVVRLTEPLRMRSLMGTFNARLLTGVRRVRHCDHGRNCVVIAQCLNRA